MWVLLKGMDHPKVRLEQVNSRLNAKIKYALGPFEPCAIINVPYRSGETDTYEGRRYVKGFSEDRVAVFVPDNKGMGR